MEIRTQRFLSVPGIAAISGLNRNSTFALRKESAFQLKPLDEPQQLWVTSKSSACGRRQISTISVSVQSTMDHRPLWGLQAGPACKILIGPFLGDDEVERSVDSRCHLTRKLWMHKCQALLARNVLIPDKSKVKSDSLPMEWRGLERLSHQVILGLGRKSSHNHCASSREWIGVAQHVRFIPTPPEPLKKGEPQSAEIGTGREIRGVDGVSHTKPKCRDSGTFLLWTPI